MKYRVNFLLGVNKNMAGNNFMRQLAAAGIPPPPQQAPALLPAIGGPIRPPALQPQVAVGVAAENGNNNIPETSKTILRPWANEPRPYTKKQRTRHNRRNTRHKRRGMTRRRK